MISTLDTLEVVKELKAAGFTEDQAEAVTRVVRRSQDIDLSSFATKADVIALKADLTALEASLKAELRASIAELRSELIKWMVGTAFALIATLTAIQKLFPNVHP
jgi:hypothetical protein